MTNKQEIENGWNQALEDKENFPNISQIFLNNTIEEEENISNFSIDTLAIVNPVDITEEEIQIEKNLNSREIGCQTLLSFPPDLILDFTTMKIQQPSPLIQSPMMSPIPLSEKSLKRNFSMISPISKNSNFAKESILLDSPDFFFTPKKMEATPTRGSRVSKRLKL
eukprot:gene3714-6603_t